MDHVRIPHNSSPGEVVDLHTILAAWTEATDRLQQTHEVLQAEVSRLTNELEQKNKELARRNRLADLGQMASHIAHEVRNGLVPMKLYLSLLRRRTLAENGATDIVDKVISGASALEATVNDLLHFSAQRDPQRVDFAVGGLLSDICDSLQPQFAAQNIAVTVKVDPTTETHADPDMLRRAVLNLVLNALDAMPTGGTLDVSAKSQAGACAITVADHGPGLPPDTLARLFEPFFTTKNTGTGLGLAIVERIAESHSGRITAENRPEGGAAFTLHLPRPIVAAKEAA